MELDNKDAIIRDLQDQVRQLEDKIYDMELELDDCRSHNADLIRSTGEGLGE